MEEEGSNGSKAQSWIYRDVEIERLRDKIIDRWRCRNRTVERQNHR